MGSYILPKYRDIMPLKIAALSNGIHIFEEEKATGWLGDCQKSNVTNEVCVSLMTLMDMNDMKKIKFYHKGKTYYFKMAEDE